MKLLKSSLTFIITAVHGQSDCSGTYPFFVGSNNGCDTEVLALDQGYNAAHLVYGGRSSDPNIVGAAGQSS